MATGSNRETKSFRSLGFWIKAEIISGLLLAVVCFVLGVVSLASKGASTVGPAANVYMFAGGIIAMGLAVVLFAAMTLVYHRATRSMSKYGLQVHIAIGVLALLAIIFAFSAVAVAIG